MKRSFILLIAALTGSFLFADPYTTFQGIVDFNASIESLMENPATMKPGRLYLLEGKISEPVIFETGSNFYAQAGLKTARWIDKKILKTYTIWLIFEDPAFEQRLFSRAPRDLPPNAIVNGARGLALLEFDKALETDEGDTIYVFIVHDFRTFVDF